MHRGADSVHVMEYAGDKIDAMAKAVIRKPKKKVCQFCKEKATGVDYKDTTLLRKFIPDRGKIRAYSSPSVDIYPCMSQCVR